jgi:hypothetical protein
MNSEKTYGRKGTLLRSLGEPEGSYELSGSELSRRELAEKMDKENLMNSGRVVVDSQESLLAPPATVDQALGEKLTLAETPPEVAFGSIPYGHRFFSPERSAPANALWSSWSQSIFDSAGRKFYGYVGDHGWTNPHLYMVEYDSDKRKITCLPEINRELGRKPGQFGDGKVHGFPGIYRPRYAENPQVWFATYWCRYPQPLEEDFDTGYTGGHIMSYDPVRQSFVDYGVPVQRASWPLHRLDAKRGLFYGLGMFGEFLCWDIETQENRWAGYLPPMGQEKDPFAVSPGMKWYNRCLLIDEETGMVYSNNLLNDQLKMIKYDPHKNRFFELDIPMPTGSPIRSHTRYRDREGLFWGLTLSGDLYSFDPEHEKLELHGRPWPLNDAFSVSIDASPGGRYLYFGIGSHGRGYPYGSPILQYDKQSGRTKILAFLFPHYYEKYGYIAGGTYSFKLDDRGERLFAIWNGSFTDVGPLNKQFRTYGASDAVNWSIPHPHDAFGHCAVFEVRIPESERRE